ncbi:hypothetical protein J6590_024589 [Homalodisca vitripennis]|nr:hypothetical protein J6590_024589 [Homalodisca vitripennis]
MKCKKNRGAKDASGNGVTIIKRTSLNGMRVPRADKQENMEKEISENITVTQWSRRITHRKQLIHPQNKVLVTPLMLVTVGFVTAGVKGLKDTVFLLTCEVPGYLPTTRGYISTPSLTTRGLGSVFCINVSWILTNNTWLHLYSILDHAVQRHVCRSVGWVVYSALTFPGYLPTTRGYISTPSLTTRCSATSAAQWTGYRNEQFDGRKDETNRCSKRVELTCDCAARHGARQFTFTAFDLS